MPKSHEQRSILVKRSFTQTANDPTYKASFRGTQQGTTSYIPYRSTKPPAQPDNLEEEQQQPTRRRGVVNTEDVMVRPRSRSHWLRYVVAAAVIIYSLYAVYTKWVDPFLTNTYNQWHYGDARVSFATMLISGKKRDLLGIGYKGEVEVIVLPDPKELKSQATVYIDPQPFYDTKNRVVLLHSGYVNQADHYLDILVEIEGAEGVSPVLYGRSDGTFQWNSPPEQKG